MHAERTILGVDIGGTKVAVGLVDGQGNILLRQRAPMNSSQDAAAGLESVVSAVHALLADPAAQGRMPSAVGVSAAGPVDARAGVIVNPPNIPCWSNYPLAAEIERATRLPARLDNDANAAGLAEAIWGAGRGFASVFYVTLGTGIGTGIVLGGEIYLGRTGAAAEGGHTTIDFRGPRCKCGKRGCIEVFAAGPALARRACERLAEPANQSSQILALAGGKLAAVTAETVATAWRAGDSLAEELLRETAGYLAIWLGNMIDVLEPEVVVVGGGMSELISAWFDHIRGLLPEWSINSRCQEIPIRRAGYGEDSGIAGAAALWYQPGRVLEP